MDLCQHQPKMEWLILHLQPQKKKIQEKKEKRNINTGDTGATAKKRKVMTRTTSINMGDMVKKGQKVGTNMDTAKKRTVTPKRVDIEATAKKRRVKKVDIGVTVRKRALSTVTKKGDIEATAKRRVIRKRMTRTGNTEATVGKKASPTKRNIGMGTKREDTTPVAITRKKEG
eukprot:PhF_6_TR36134/c1_g1_i1/m.52479